MHSGNEENSFTQFAKRKTAIKEYSDYQPEANKCYFRRAFPSRIDFGCMTTVIPCYNEERHELERCLLSLHQQESLLERRKYENFILVVLDGIERASESMKEYLREMFPRLGQFYERVEELLKDKSKVLTFVVQSFEVDTQTRHKRSSMVNVLPLSHRTHRSGDTQQEASPAEVLMNISLIIKLDNRQKHNSHEVCDLSFSLPFPLLSSCGKSHCTLVVLPVIRAGI